MALKKNINLDDTMSMLDGISNQVKESKQKQREPERPPFKKPTSDYYRLDMIVRETIQGKKGHPVITEDIKTDYKDYITVMANAEGLSITKYIHKLIDQDMEQNKRKYKQLCKLNKQ